MTRSIRFVGVLFAVSTAAACAPEANERPPADAAVAISPAFSAEDTASIMAALDTWQAASAGKLHLRVTITDDEHDITIKPGSPSGARTWAGFTTRERGRTWIVIDTTRLDNWSEYAPPAGTMVQSVATHELGHAFGLSHAPAGLMIARGWFGVEVDDDALAKFNDLY